jgi:Ser/Thr protein kinase RdoA (MazF antagonist)
MTSKTTFSAADFQQILAHYQLGRYRHAEPIPQGTVQTNYVLETTTGKFVFRCYENRSLESVLFESHVLTFLKEHHFPCPGPFPNRQGQLVGRYQAKPYMLFEFMPGHHLEQPAAHHKQQLIRQVAQLQRLTQAYQPPYRDYRWNYTPARCQALAADAAHKLNTAEAQAKLAWLSQQVAALELPPSLPQGICHGDFHFSNVLFEADQLVALLDFDDANYTYLIFDPACLIDSWAWPHPSNTLDLASAREIVQEYNRHRPLAKIEQQHLFDAHKLSILFDCIWFFGRGSVADFYEKRKIDHLDQLGRHGYRAALFSA